MTHERRPPGNGWIHRLSRFLQPVTAFIELPARLPPFDFMARRLAIRLERLHPMLAVLVLIGALMACAAALAAIIETAVNEFTGEHRGLTLFATAVMAWTLAAIAVRTKSIMIERWLAAARARRDNA